MTGRMLYGVDQFLVFNTPNMILGALLNELLYKLRERLLAGQVLLGDLLGLLLALLCGHLQQAAQRVRCQFGLQSV